MTTTLTQALEPYQRFDPQGWVNVYEQLPVWGGAIALVVGVLMLLFGNGRLFRLVAGPIAALVAFLWAPLLAVKLGFGANAKQIAMISSIALGGLGFLYPPGALFFVCGIPGGLVAGELAGASDWALGFFPGFLVAGAMAAAAHRWIGAVASSVTGGWLIVVGLLSCLAPLGSVSSSLAGQPWGCIIAALLFAVAGIVYQLFVRLSPEERARLKEEKRKAKKRRDETKAVESRWSGYSKNKGGVDA